MELPTITANTETEIGSYFVANYPPFSAWSPDVVPAVLDVLNSPPPDGSVAPLGLYLHIPFCRKRCTFCYFRVYTDKNARDVDVYLDALVREIELYASSPALAGRSFEFVYFGGGTPSFLSSEQLRGLVDRIGKRWSWDSAREVTFECEPGTLQKNKLAAIKEIGTTRLSLGVEHFDDEILSANGRAHKSPEIYRAYNWAREVGFEQINIDLIAGMVGDTEASWHGTVDEALRLAPDSVTIYQLELPHNTTIAREMKATAQPVQAADWPTKRAWVDAAFRRFEDAGYLVSSAYTVTRPPDHGTFVYRDALWHGADMIGTGVASFSQLAGVHFQNEDRWDDYVGRLQRGKLPLARALVADQHQRLIRELVLQLKLGRLDAGYFRDKFAVEIVSEFHDAFDGLRQEGLLRIDGDVITLSREGLIRADGLLPAFFEPKFQNARYS